MTGFLGESKDAPPLAPPVSPVDPAVPGDATRPDPVPAPPDVPVVEGDSAGQAPADAPPDQTAVPSTPPPGVAPPEDPADGRR